MRRGNGQGLPRSSTGLRADEGLRSERCRRLVERPGLRLFRRPAFHAPDHVRVPARGMGPIKLGRDGRMVGMAMVDPDEVELPRPCGVVRSEEFKGIDRVTPATLFRRRVSRPTGFDAPARLRGAADQEAAGLLRIGLARMGLDESQDRGRNLDCHGPSSQYSSFRYRYPASGNTSTMTPSRIRSARRIAASNAAPLDVPTR